MWLPNYCCIIAIIIAVSLSCVTSWTADIGPYKRRLDIIGNHAVNGSQGEYETRYLSLPVDHFSYANQDEFRLRYLVAEQHWKGEGAPIFFYTGNEGDITLFCNNTGFMWDIAPEFGAMVVFAEHRYYGDSMPYGKDSFKDPVHLGYLSSEQALADFADVIIHIKATVPGASSSPVIAFGGSYGGMLSAWFRMKYPHIIQGALAASAPVWQFEGLTPCNSFYQTITADFQQASEECVININNTWGVIDKMAESEAGRLALMKALRLCTPLKSASDAQEVKDWLSEIYGNLAMMDYPYETSFVEPLPAWPVEQFCLPLSKELVSDIELMEALAEGVNIYMNFTGTAQCFNRSQEAVASMGLEGWGFQACTEMIMPLCTDGIHDMFEASPWNMSKRLENCKKNWGVTARPEWIKTQYGGKNLSAASNIIFSNGELDPWSSGGVLESISETVVAIVIEEGAHHLDLRSANVLDPPSVISARKKEKQIIKRWIWEYTHECPDDSRFYLFGLNFGLSADIQYPPSESSASMSSLIVLLGVFCIICLAAIVVNSIRKVRRARILRENSRVVLTPEEMKLLLNCDVHKITEDLNDVWSTH